MPTLFTEPVELLTAAHVAGVIGWPESLTVEFKEALPGRDGRDDAWVGGGKVEAYARDKLFKEVVAFANTSGGHLVLGIRETEDAPPAAAAVTPVPRCVDLAERLARMAQSIDPPIPLLLVQGLPTSGDAGLVVFRVPASRSAPHRSTDKECYVRRGTESVAMAMREIQDMTLAAGRREERTDARFARAAERFAAWMPSPIEGGTRAVGFRITAVPVGGAFDLGRLYGRTGLVPTEQDYTLLLEGRKLQAHVLRRQERVRPIVRGMRRTYDEEGVPTYLELFSDGVVDLAFRIGPREEKPLLALGWIAAYVIHVARVAHAMRAAAATPEAEYALEVELRANPEHELVGLLGWSGNGFGFDDRVGEGLRLPLTLPRISFGPVSEIDQVVSNIMTDLHDASGARLPEPLNLHLQRP